MAGATGTGKSVSLNAMIMSILYKANPADVRFIMIDPKMLELSMYENIPHLLVPVVTDPKKAANALANVMQQMDLRYRAMHEKGVRNIESYNRLLAREEAEKRAGVIGLIKANFPARISFQVTSRIDSRTILDAIGSERLLGEGDCLFMPPGTARLTRLHGAFVSEAEIQRAVEFWKAQGGPQYKMEL